MIQTKKQKKLMGMAYGIGASIVILGALFKIMHLSVGPITGGGMLMLGMGVEAFIFFISAFEPLPKEYDWERVFPELRDESAEVSKGKLNKKGVSDTDVETMLSQKLDNILKEAKLDANLIAGLGQSIKNFQGAVQPLAAASESLSSTNKYNEQVTMAAAQMESLNSLYKTQVESATKQANLNKEMVENAQKLQEQMQSLATNLSSLNGVYGGMLSAMNKK